MHLGLSRLNNLNSNSKNQYTKGLSSSNAGADTRTINYCNRHTSSQSSLLLYILTASNNLNKVSLPNQSQVLPQSQVLFEPEPKLLPQSQVLFKPKVLFEAESEVIFEAESEAIFEPESEEKSNLYKDSNLNTTPKNSIPWSHFGGIDNTNSRYIPILASQTGKFKIFSTSQNMYLANTSPVIANDGTTYIGFNTIDGINVTFNQGYLVAFNTDGSFKWTYQLINNDIFDQSTPVIDTDGTIYCGSAQGHVYAINSNGTLKWQSKYTLGNEGFGEIIGTICASLMIDINNNIYFSCNGIINTNNPIDGCKTLLFSIKSSNGDINWKYNPYPSNYFNSPQIYDSIAIDKNNNIYFNFQLINQNMQGSLVCLDPNGLLLWEYTNLHDQIYLFINSRPMLSENNLVVYILSTCAQLPGHVYLDGISTTDGKIINSNSIQLSSLSIKENSLVRDVNNTLYFSANILNNDTKTLADVALYSVTNNTINWQYTIEIDNMAQIVTIDNTPVIGSDGTIYFGAHINDNLNKRMTAYMYALNPDGTLKWKTKIPNDEFTTIETSPIINADGNVIVATKVYNPNNKQFSTKIYSFI